MSLLKAVWNQFIALPYPDEDCTGRVVIVTGSNVGLGLEAARHFVQLNAAKVILACRSLDKAVKAKQDIEESTKRTGVVDVWQLDLASFDSVKEFAARVSGLERLDIVINNASVLTTTWEISENHELQLTVNVISTVLLSLLLLPFLRRTGLQFNITPHLVIVSSDGAFLAAFPERKSKSIMQALDEKNAVDPWERYITSKLLQLMALRKLASLSDASGKGHVTINSLNPGFCQTQLFRGWDFFPVNTLMWLGLRLAGRTPEMGSRTLMTAAFAGEETHGNWMANCKPHIWPKLMKGENGEELTDRFWNELVEVLEGIQPGVTGNL